MNKRELDTKLEESYAELLQKFPFENYINPARKSGYFDMVRKVEKWSGVDVDVLDFRIWLDVMKNALHQG